MDKLNIKSLQPHNRPDEKFLKLGPKALSDAELLAIILRTGSKNEHSVELSERILKDGSGDCSILNIFRFEIDELMQINGIGKVKALQIKAIEELSLRIACSSVKHMLDCSHPETIALYYMEQLRHKSREVVVLMMLNSLGEFIRDSVLFTGTVDSALFSPREIFQEALKNNAVNIILIHNHPSGSPVPSRQDIVSTKRVAEAGKIVGVNLVDHIIIGDRKYISLKEEGLIDG